jgi:hypothetical protein
MGLTRCVVALLALFAIVPSAHAKKCTDTSGFAAVMESVEAAVPCASATKHGKYVKQAKKAIGSALTGACKKQFAKRFLAQSTCGRPNFVLCCATNKKGKDISKVVKAGKCKKGTSCNDPDLTSVGEGCTAQGTCVTTTTTTTSTTTAPTTIPSPTTTTIPPSTILDFTLSAAGGPCGDARDASSTVLKTLTCGGLSIGGGASIIPEGPTPDGSISRFGLDCTGTSCTIVATSTAPAVNAAGPDCTDTGCNFGTPLPIPNPTISGITTCVLNTWSAPASGTLDLATGTSSTNVPLMSDTYLTGNLAQPCPRCSASGTPSSPGTGTCDRGPRKGMACTTTSSTGLTRDCPTGGADASNPCTPGGGNCVDGAHVGVISVNLSPLTTGIATKTAADGNFCPGQSDTMGHAFGCFGSAACRTITENGVAAGAITKGTPASATLAAVFCIASTGNGLVDASADLAGPGAVSLPGMFLVKDVAGASSTTTTTPTTTTPPTTSPVTTTTMPAPRCGDGTINQADEQCDSGLPNGGFVGGTCEFCTGQCTCVACDPAQRHMGTVDFALTASADTCGDTRDGSNAVIKNLTCGGLSIGAGASLIPEGPTPDGSQSRFALDCCGTSCTISHSDTAPAVNTAVPDCTNTGCNFGTPLPIPNPTIPGITSCVLNTWNAPASGTLDLTSGVSSTDVPLISDTYLTGNLGQPCPKCSATGTPSSPGHGTCDRGPRTGLMCTTTSSTGYTRDCPTGGADGTHPCTPGGGACIDGSHVGPINVNLSPLTTGTASMTNATGNFCPGQSNTSGHMFGCFGSSACRTITENGVPAGTITAGTPAGATLASVFCIGATGNGLVDASADLPGPGAVSLPGTYTVNFLP